MFGNSFSLSTSKPNTDIAWISLKNCCKTQGCRLKCTSDFLRFIPDGQKKTKLKYSSPLGFTNGLAPQARCSGRPCDPRSSNLNIGVATGAFFSNTLSYGTYAHPLHLSQRCCSCFADPVACTYVGLLSALTQFANFLHLHLILLVLLSIPIFELIKSHPLSFKPISQINSPPPPPGGMDRWVLLLGGWVRGFAIQ